VWISAGRSSSIKNRSKVISEDPVQVAIR